MTKNVKLSFTDNIKSVIETGNQFMDDKDEENNVNIDYDYSRPPVEDYLVKHTLWPELNKLYGHAYEILALACTSDGKYIASSCKS